MHVNLFLSKPRQLEGTNPTVTGVKAFLKEIEDLHAGHAGAMSTAKLVNTMRRVPTYLLLISLI
jgi:hypothetical protein